MTYNPAAMGMRDQYQRAAWRLLISSPQDGATNMAIDEAVLEAVTTGDVPPTLRFYEWDPPCLSLGIGQPASSVDWGRCARHGWHVVRRPTGGQAILHTDELTYSVCAPVAEPRVAGDIVASYRQLAAGLLAGIRTLGLEPAQARPSYPSDGAAPGPVCFEGPARYEITVGLRKLVGSAQSRRYGGVLQHGTLPLTGEITRIVDALAYEADEARTAARERLAQRALTLESALGRRVTFIQAVEALTTGFAQALNLSLIPGELTTGEREAARRIRASKYGHDSWTCKR